MRKGTPGAGYLKGGSGKPIFLLFLLRIFDFAVECMMRWRKDGIYKWVKPNTPKAIEPNLGPGGQTIPASGLSCSIRRMAESTSRLVGTSQGHQTGG